MIFLIQLNIVLLLFLILCVGPRLIFLFINYKDREQALEHFEKLYAVLEDAKSIAYQKLFRDYILVYSSSGFRIDKDKIDELQKLYINLVFRCCGPNVISDLKLIHGNVESISINLVNDFIERLTNDELKIIKPDRDRE